MKVGILNGGFSSERDISLMTGEQIERALLNDHEVMRIDVKDETSWINAVIAAQLDVIFVALHGRYGEDGSIQKQLDTLNIPYTGSGVKANRKAFDKDVAKKEATAAGLIVPDSCLLNKNEATDEFETIGLPCVIKPNTSGSSVGITIARTAEERTQAIKKAFEESEQILIEQFIQGRELTCGVLGNSGSKLDALPVVEIIAGKDSPFFDYQAKYFSNDTQEVCPAKIPTELSETIQELSKRIHEHIGCSGLTRSDFIVDSKGDAYFLEINTIPGQTEASICPKEAKAAGMTFQELIERQLDLAIRESR